MFAKRLLQKAVNHHQQKVEHGGLTSEDLDPRIAIHYGVPSTASVLAFDHFQSLLAIGTLDGRIKVIGGDSIEGLLISPKQLPYKNLEFLQNQGYLVGISNDNDIQVWNLENRSLVSSLQWVSNITSFAMISGSHFMYVGDEYGLMSVMKFDVENGKLLQLPYHISANSISEAAGFPFPKDQAIVGVLPQPCSSGNRLLIAYQNGLIILWDVSEAQILFAGGGKDLQLKDEVVGSSSEVDVNLQDDTSEHQLGDKEISALCWASSSGSVLAVGYVDGDILFWNTSCAVSTKSQQALSSSSNIVKLQLSSAERRLPVIVLQWSKNHKSRNDCDGQLFIYGGDEIGSEEVLTVINLEWSSGMGTLRCVGRADLTLSASFADMILLPNAGATGKVDLFVLTNPGQLHFYDDASLSTLISQGERSSISAVEFPAVIPIADPSMTVAKLSKLPTEGNSSKALLEVASVMKLGSILTPASGAKWPLTGGVPSQLSTSKDNGVERVYLAGYSDGSVRIWDATYPVLSFIFLLEGEVQGIKVAGSKAPVTSLDFCLFTLSLAVGNECGLVRLYDLKGCSDGTSFHFVTETKSEVQILSQAKGPQCRAVFCLLDSPIRALKFANSGAKLAVGFECARVAVLDTISVSILFLMDNLSSPSSPIISMTWTELTYSHSLVKSPKHSETKVPVNTVEEVLFVLTKDAKINVVDGSTGNMIGSRPWHLKKESIAISMYVLASSISVSVSSNEMQPESHQDTVTKNEPMPGNTTVSINSHEVEQHTFSETTSSRERLLDSTLLLCCEDSLHLYSTKSLIQGNNKAVRKVKHTKACCWTTTLKKDEKVCGLVLLFQTGVIEIRSLPDLELVKESSLMSILRWNFKANMDKTMSSSDTGQITLANGCELVFISLLAGGNDFRIPESLPCFHDKVLAAAADAALSISLTHKKKQGTQPGILGGIVKGFRGGKMAHTEDFNLSPKTNLIRLEGIFLKSPFSDSSSTVTDNEEDVELDIDDIEIDEPLPTASTSSHDFKNKKREKGTERERLLQGGSGTDDIKPRVRTPDEIMATYRTAEEAKEKLKQRQERLERISRRTEELKNGAEDFASLANELVKTMEGRRKWWHI